MKINFSFFSRKLEPLNIITISRSSILNNFHLFQKLLPHYQIWPVLKSNAYGHGLSQIVTILNKEKFNYFVVDSYYEALKIWEMSKKPVLIIGTILPVNFQFLNFSKIALSIQDMESLDELVCLQKPVRIHLKINTGMNRQGVDPAHVSKYIAKIKKNPHIQLEGVFSHLADADNSDNSYTQKQITIFDTVVENIIKLGLTPRYCHLSATSGSLKVKSSHINAIRLGLGLYGYNPLTNTDTQFKQLSELTPALNFYSHFTKIRSIKKGQKVSYNCTFESKKDGKIGVIPVGYYEGFDCRLSNAGFIKHVDNFYPVAGRVCMNLSVIDLTNTINPSLKKSSIKQNSSFNTPSAFDKVQIISSNSDDKNSVKNIAQICNTIDYEILVKLSESIRRTIVD